MRQDETVDAGIRWGVTSMGPASGEDVLLLHGFPEDRRSWDLQMEPLAAAGFCVHAADLPGYGRTDPPPDYTLETVAQEVLQLIETWGPDPIHLIGHDWGGIIGHVVASRHPRAVRSLVAACAPHPGAFSAVLRDPWQLARSWYVGLFQIPKIEKVLAVGDGAIFHRILSGGHPARFDEAAMARALRYYRDNFNPVRLATNRAGRIPQPGLVIHARHDAAIGDALMKRTAEWFDDLRGFEVLDGGHFVHREKAQQFTALVTDFLTRIPG